MSRTTAGIVAKRLSQALSCHRFEADPKAGPGIIEAYLRQYVREGDDLKLENGELLLNGATVGVYKWEGSSFFIKLHIPIENIDISFTL